MTIFSDRLKDLRSKNNLTQKALGELIGLSTRGIQSCEISNCNPSADTLIKVADYFEVSTDYLLGRDEYVSSKGLPKDK